jgi:hypothetical protein
VVTTKLTQAKTGAPPPGAHRQRQPPPPLSPAHSLFLSVQINQYASLARSLKFEIASEYKQGTSKTLFLLLVLLLLLFLASKMRPVSVLECDVHADLYQVLRVASVQPDAYATWIDWTPSPSSCPLILSFRVSERLSNGYDNWTLYAFTPAQLALCNIPACSLSDRDKVIVSRWMRVSRVAVDSDTGGTLRYEIQSVTRAHVQMQTEWIQGEWLRTHYADLVHASESRDSSPSTPQLWLDPVSFFSSDNEEEKEEETRDFLTSRKRKHTEEDGDEEEKPAVIVHVAKSDPTAIPKKKRSRILRQLESTLLASSPQSIMRT